MRQRFHWQHSCGSAAITWFHSQVWGNVGGGVSEGNGHSTGSYLLVDEAQNLSDDALEGLRLLSNLKTDAGILSMLRFSASMMPTTLPSRCGAAAEMVTSLPLLFSSASLARERSVGPSFNSDNR
jgi:hypothetical protein